MNLPHGKMTFEKYDFWYKEQGENGYASRILVANEEIIAHNAFINMEYSINGEPKSVKLSSGGMAKVSHSGAFYKLMKEGIKEFKESTIIAFPNKNSEPFFTKIFKFNYVENNFFTLEKDQFVNFSITKPIKQTLKREDSFFKRRIENHKSNEYSKLVIGDNTLYYKAFGNNEVDIIYVNNFDEIFPLFLQKLFDLGFQKMNIIHWDKNFIEQFGFVNTPNNLFVYNNMEEVFECQMIDSDIF